VDHCPVLTRYAHPQPVFGRERASRQRDAGPLRRKRRQRPPDGAALARGAEFFRGQISRGPGQRQPTGASRAPIGELPCAAIRCSRSSARRIAGVDRTAQPRGGEFSPAVELVVSFHEGAHSRRESSQVKRQLPARPTFRVTRATLRKSTGSARVVRVRANSVSPAAIQAIRMCGPEDYRTRMR